MGENFASPVYIITEHTKAILTKDSAYYRSRILEVSQELNSALRPEQIIDNTCILYGSTLQGRRDSAKDLLKVKSKVPVPVIPEKGVFMLPTCASKNKNNVWVSFYHIKSFERQGNGTYVSFYDGTGLFINTSESTFDMQFKRTGQIIARLNRSFFFGSGPYWWRRRY
ncbi:MAG TPA: competence protein ComK [Lentibacillus sp.]|uniref:competence protein ComK n=1 Tax=Lentibacillus sp. TaxID=1925746 RepID=UPI002B4ACA26|nr:competence protein ComK [Lentibacillus sp.]HLR61502.1 competence protein ComK [Lentibacillus sp.]